MSLRMRVGLMPRSLRSRCCVTVVMLATLLLASRVAWTHELESHRVTVVQREPGHLQLTFRLYLTELLHELLAPGRSRTEFVLQGAAMDLPALERDLVRARRAFEASTRLSTRRAASVPLTNWKWPDTAQVRQLLQQAAMATLVDRGGGSHEEPTEISAEATSPVPFVRPRLHLPPALERALVVSYRPHQQWAGPAQTSVVLEF